MVNLLQGIFVEIYEDEAYYALFGAHLAWGYFDHPPMVALMTFLSSKLCVNNLGVRLLTVLVSCLTLWMLWLLLDERQPDHRKVGLFFILVASIPMVNVYGFVTTPDVALLLFSALFLWAYRRYLQEKTWLNALWMGLLMGCMVYSKYHAVLFLGLIVLSNLSLLKELKFYVACLLALALLTPHLVWQVEAGFPSLKYHLLQRSQPFRMAYFLEYLPNQLLVFNPFTFGAALYVLVRTRAENEFERGLRLLLLGFLCFFWLMTFRGHVEPHWTIVAMIPMVVLIYRNALKNERLRIYIRRFVFPSLLLVVLFRIAMLTPLSKPFGFYGKEAYYKAIETVAGDAPVAFRGSFQPPALYHYFTGKESATLRCYYDRKTQFDLWQFDTAWIGRPVFVCDEFGSLPKDYQVGEVRFRGFLAERFQTANRLNIDFELLNIPESPIPVLHHGDTIRMAFSIYNPCSKDLDFHHEPLDMCLKVMYLPSDDYSYCIFKDIDVFPARETYHGQLYSVIGEDVAPGRRRLTLGVGDRIATFVTNECFVEVEIAKE